MDPLPPDSPLQRWTLSPRGPRERNLIKFFIMGDVGTNGALLGASEDSIEFQLLTAYVNKRRPSDRIFCVLAASSDTPLPDGVTNKNCLERMGKLKILFNCIPCQKGDSKLPLQSSEIDGRGLEFRALDPEGTSPSGVVVAVANKLTRIVDSVPLDPEDIETDTSDDVIQTIVDLLRESGDCLNEEIKKNKSLAQFFNSSFSYSLFEKVTSSFLQKVDPADIPSKAPEQAKVALTFEVTSRLTAVDCHPMNVIMGFGAKYLQENCSAWVKQHGGWEKAFDSEDDEEVH
ncbi:hypothetical protein GJAV_G00161250 [Gymnothorax javanicus]|nr:hypothetical protein GJAV_G00161250 [Gymnothorax javanicus]